MRFLRLGWLANRRIVPICSSCWSKDPFGAFEVIPRYCRAAYKKGRGARMEATALDQKSHPGDGSGTGHQTCLSFLVGAGGAPAEKRRQIRCIGYCRGGLLLKRSVDRRSFSALVVARAFLQHVVYHCDCSFLGKIPGSQKTPLHLFVLALQILHLARPALFLFCSLLPTGTCLKT